MAIRVYEVGDGLGGYLRYEGVVTARDEFAVHSLLSAAPRFSQWMFGLLDASTADKLDYTASQVIAIAEGAKRISKLTRPGFIVALIAPMAYGFGMARMWQMYSEQTAWETKVFRGPEDANHWLRERVLVSFRVTLDRPNNESGLVELKTDPRPSATSPL